MDDVGKQNKMCGFWRGDQPGNKWNNAPQISLLLLMEGASQLGCPMVDSD